VLLVTLRARPGLGPQLEEAAHEFVEATRRLVGTLGSTIQQSSIEPLTWFLIERFSGQDALARHMASEYFGQLQLAQQALLAEPVEVVFMAGERP
jgi:quinol monooxygenase YgiN